MYSATFRTLYIQGEKIIAIKGILYLFIWNIKLSKVLIVLFSFIIDLHVLYLHDLQYNMSFHKFFTYEYYILRYCEGNEVVHKSEPVRDRGRIYAS